jgi:NADPH:quinone reductase
VEKESDHHEHPRNHARLAADVAERPAGPALDHRRAGTADLVLESAGGDTFSASLAAARRVTGRVVVYGLAGGDASITNWDLVYQHQIHVIGLNIGMLIQAAPQIFGEVMGELFVLMAAGALTPSQPTAYELADGPKALTELEARATVGKLALLP